MPLSRPPHSAHAVASSASCWLPHPITHARHRQMLGTLWSKCAVNDVARWAVALRRHRACGEGLGR
eukprot:15441202-Alexandrium_andersonii.AAC.1